MNTQMWVIGCRPKRDERRTENNQLLTLSNHPKHDPVGGYSLPMTYRHTSDGNPAHRGLNVTYLVPGRVRKCYGAKTVYF